MRKLSLFLLENWSNLSTTNTNEQRKTDKVNLNVNNNSFVYGDTDYTYFGKGVVYQISNTARLYVTYKMILDEEEYNNLPEGVEFTSNVVINIEVEAWRKLYW